MSEITSKSYYAVIPANVRYDQRLCANEKLLYGEITALCNERGYCWSSNKYFAELYNVTKETISRWVRNICECGYIKTTLIYKEGTKEIKGRHIFISQEGIDEKIKTPIDKIVKDNTTINNTTINNNISSPSQVQEVKDSDLKIIDLRCTVDSPRELIIIKNFHSLFCKLRTKPGQPFTHKVLRKAKVSGWKKDLDAIMRIDQRSVDQIRDILEFLKNGKDDFWRQTIDSLSGLRNNYDKIVDKMEAEKLLTVKKTEEKTKEGVFQGNIKRITKS
jgi:hypothetical protein